MNIKDKILENAAKLIDKATASEIDGWPPVCEMIFYQPERPQTMCVNEETEKRP